MKNIKDLTTVVKYIFYVDAVSGFNGTSTCRPVHLLSFQGKAHLILHTSLHPFGDF